MAQISVFMEPRRWLRWVAGGRLQANPTADRPRPAGHDVRRPGRRRHRDLDRIVSTPSASAPRRADHAAAPRPPADLGLVDQRMETLEAHARALQASVAAFDASTLPAPQREAFDRARVASDLLQVMLANKVAMLADQERASRNRSLPGQGRRHRQARRHRRDPDEPCPRLRSTRPGRLPAHVGTRPPDPRPPPDPPPCPEPPLPGTAAPSGNGPCPPAPCPSVAS